MPATLQRASEDHAFNLSSSCPSHCTLQPVDFVEYDLDNDDEDFLEKFNKVSSAAGLLVGG